MAVSKAAIGVLFVDIVGSTRLYRSHGDERAEALVGAALQRCCDAAERYRGRRIKSIGDALMCVFPDAESAARAAMDMQREARVPLPGEDLTLELRVGFASGEAVERDGDYFGDVVNIAARVSDMAKSGQILTTESTGSELPEEIGASVRVFDNTPVKGITESILVSQVVWDRRSHTEVFSASDIVGALKLVLRHRDVEAVLTPLKLPFVIGRQQDCDLVVDAPFASRRHLRIEYRRGKFVLVDESTNGTYVAHGEGEEKLAYVRNEPFALFATGRFWLGALPEEAGSEPVSFETE
ncbi:adenylate/guanylate cyclase domain-containing protein [Algiphilus sp.]|uniref:adenylate/guanylate cyclase domain-containing protein n=1 Tax=Algiphilus sp. TaxID=1872431 RepID=UPI0025C28A37|nr:adenylate/guanylate cyclase domain-containing protein [Algiphilus sp.]MCK5769311.1 adenylate/guanylate cyclase domain-containing protein [Algiphilus sp.]